MTSCCPFSNELAVITGLPSTEDIDGISNIIANYLVPYTPKQMMKDPFFIVQYNYHAFQSKYDDEYEGNPRLDTADIYWSTVNNDVIEKVYCESEYSC